MRAIQETAPQLGVRTACEALGVPRSSFYRHRWGRRLTHPRRWPRPTTRALSEQARQEVLDVLHSEPYADKAPAQVWAAVLDGESRLLCSVSTMYRILVANGEVRERRNQLRHPSYPKPVLEATGPRQLWSWDITKLLGPAKWTYYYLYVVLDVFSRYVVGWTIQHRESARLAKELIAQAVVQQGIEPGQLTIHADRGTSMRSKMVAHLLADLGVTKTHSRPYTSTDNPYSEAQFKTLKYRPDFPQRFGSIQDARAFGCPFFCWYNHEHRHSGIGLMTPASVHYGRAEQLHEQRAQTLAAAYAAHPERFAHGVPQPPKLPTAAWINQPETKQEAH